MTTGSDRNKRFTKTKRILLKVGWPTLWDSEIQVILLKIVFILLNVIYYVFWYLLQKPLVAYMAMFFNILHRSI